MSDKAIRVPTMLCGIIGWPLGHTLSPLLHNWAFETLGLPGCYLAWPTPPERLVDMMDAVRALPIHGLSVTIPHKEAVRPYLDEISENARLAGAVNTLYWRDGRLCGENTDIAGLAAPLMGRNFTSALILGAGGAASAAVVGLRQAGVQDILITNRNRERAETLAREYGLGVMDWTERNKARVELLVNATPLGMAGASVDQTPYDAAWFRSGETVYDLVYNPGETRLLREAASAGCATINGLEMLVRQGQAQFRLWTGREFDVDGGMRLLGVALRGK